MPIHKLFLPPFDAKGGVCVRGSQLLLFTVNSALEVCLWRQLGVEGEISSYEWSEVL